MSRPIRLLALLSIAAPGLLLAADTGPKPDANPLRAAIAQANAEAEAAEKRAGRLEAAAAKAGDDARELAARQQAAAEEIVAAEALISAADFRVRLIDRIVAERQARLAEARAPAGALLAGLAMMASKPPVAALIDQGSVDDFVRIRILLDSTLPEIERRSAALADEIRRESELAAAAQAARSAAAKQRALLQQRMERFAQLEQQALALSESRTAEALTAGDTALARSEQAERLTGASGQMASAHRLASELAQLAAPPGRPGKQRRTPASPLPYILPSDAEVAEGFGTVAANGVRARGIELSSRRGSTVVAPADGVVRFAGPFRSNDGIMIIEHDGGWTSLLINVAPRVDEGGKVRMGEVIGRALGPIQVELSHRGTRRSPALIAGSYALLSNGRERE